MKISNLLTRFSTCFLILAILALTAAAQTRPPTATDATGIRQPCKTTKQQQNAVTRYAEISITGTGDIQLTPCDQKQINFRAENLVSTITNNLTPANIPPLDASKIVSGRFTPATIPPLDASKIASGTFDSARISLDYAATNKDGLLRKSDFTRFSNTATTLQSLTSSLITNSATAWNGNYFVSIPGLDNDNAVLGGNAAGLPTARTFSSSGFATLTRPSGNFNFDVTIPDATGTTRGVLNASDYGRFNNFGTQINAVTTDLTQFSLPIYDGSGRFINSPLSILSARLRSTVPIELANTGVTANSVVLTDTNKALISTSLAANQILLGQSSGAPLATTLTAGTGVTLTPGTGTLTINAAGSSFTGVTTNRLLQYDGTKLANSNLLYTNSSGVENLIGSFAYPGFSATTYNVGSSGFSYQPDPGVTANAVLNGSTVTITGQNTTNTANVTISPTTVNFTAQNVKLSTSAPTNSILYKNGVSNIAALTLTNGQLLIGSTGAAPTATTPTAGNGIAITTGAGALTVTSAGGISKTTPTTNSLTTDTTETALITYPTTTGATSDFDFRTGKADALRFENNVDMTGAVQNKSFRVVLGTTELFNSGNTMINGSCRVRTKIIASTASTISGFVDVICSDTAYAARSSRFKNVAGSAGQNYIVYGTSATAGNISAGELTVEPLRAP